MKNKRVLLVAAITITIASLIVGLFLTRESRANYAAKRWLSNKYDWSMSDIKIIDYQKDYFSSDIGFFFLDAPNTVTYHNKQWICQYNERQFNLEKYGNTYADDYQLEDIFNWCTDFLKQNVNKNISGVEISGDIFFNGYTYVISLPDLRFNKTYKNDYKLLWDSNKVFTESDSELIINTLSEKDKLAIFYTVDNLSEYIDISNDIELANENYYSISENILDNLKDKQISNNSLIVLVNENNYRRCNYGFVLSEYCYSYNKEQDTGYIYDWDFKG